MSLGDAYHHLHQIEEGKRIREEMRRYDSFKKTTPPHGGWNTCPNCKKGELLVTCTSQVTTWYPLGAEGQVDLAASNRTERPIVNQPSHPVPKHLECRSCFKVFKFEEFQHLDNNEAMRGANYGAILGRYMRPINYL